MKLKQSSMDFHAFISVYRDQVEGCFIKKIYQVNKKEFYFQIYRSDLKRKGLFVSLERGIAFHDPVLPGQASSLAMTLRRMLSERRISSISQINFDRVIKIVLSTGQEIILELFREGNLIITNEGKIEWALVQREWKNRKIMKGETYVPPSLVDPLTMGEGDLRELLTTSRGSLVQTLATRMNLGGEAGEELVLRLGLKKESPAKECESSASVIRDGFLKLLGESEQGKAFYYQNENIVSPLELRHLGDTTCQVFEELNDGYSKYFSENPFEEGGESSLSRRIRSQEKSIEEFRKLSEEFRLKGTTILSNLKEFQRIISTVGSSRKVEPGRDYSPFSLLSVTPDRKTFKISFQDTEFDLRYDQTAGSNADRMFEAAKQYREKISGAMTALENSRKASVINEKKVKKKRNRQWFETYRWFYTSEGFLTLSGRDRKTNETVVKKHMSSGDIYVHADLYGAPSTVIKGEPGRRPGDESIREACIFSLSMSRAWQAGIASGSAYWVFPEQVSKTPESGEYVSTGSWIVRGKRNYMFDLPLELIITEREVGGLKVPMISPNVEGREYAAKIVPGDEKRNSVSKKISSALGVERDEIEAILPPGDSMIKEIREFTGESS
ncbi:MAG: NFACT family protein [Candidatus Thermoplasmatota archaeon]|nr:NFACT family protein [Candidatus Thermoplasmatota archaeon]MCL5438219.1 NFACT family protein [Candidatus Thermoplasmatota archaeon]